MPRKLQHKSLVPQRIHQKNGFVCVELKVCMLYSWCISPNGKDEDFEQMLYELGDSNKEQNSRVLVAGNFNAKYPEWRTDKHSNMLTKWLVSMDLVVKNEGQRTTFERGSQKSIVYLTLISKNMVGIVTDWKVGEEIHSCHKYIVYNNKDKVMHLKPIVSLSWNTARFDPIKCREALGRIDNGRKGPKMLVSALAYCYNQSVPRKMKHRRHAIYWWSEEVADALRQSIRK